LPICNKKCYSCVLFKILKNACIDFRRNFLVHEKINFFWFFQEILVNGIIPKNYFRLNSRYKSKGQSVPVRVASLNQMRSCGTIRTEAFWNQTIPSLDQSGLDEWNPLFKQSNISQTSPQKYWKDSQEKLKLDQISLHCLSWKARKVFNWDNIEKCLNSLHNYPNVLLGKFKLLNSDSSFIFPFFCPLILAISYKM